MGRKSRDAENNLERNIEVLIQQTFEYNGVKRGLWTVKFAKMERTLGYCDFRSRSIVISTAIVGNSKVSFDTAMHEVAHALAGPGEGHGPAWKAIAIRLGASPKASVEFNDESNFGQLVKVPTPFGEVSAILGTTKVNVMNNEYLVTKLSKSTLVGKASNGKMYKLQPFHLHPNANDAKKVQTAVKTVKTDHGSFKVVLGESTVEVRGRFYVAIDVFRKNILGMDSKGSTMLIPGFYFDPVEIQLRQLLKK